MWNGQQAMPLRLTFTPECSAACFTLIAANNGDQNDKDNNIYYRIQKTTFYEGGPKEIRGLHTEALGVLFPVDSMDSCEEMMIQDWPGALYKKDDTAFLCWTYSPEVTYVLEYTPSKIDDSEIIKMAESAEPVK